jgi:RNA polymerase sigma-70 factor, ECF subfamily
MRLWPLDRTASLALSEQLADTAANVADQLTNVDREAFRHFYDWTGRPLWAYLLRVSARRDIADDLLQESYCRFLAATLPQMDAAESRSYLFRIATNLLRDRWRRKESAHSNAAVDLSCEDDPETRADVRRAFAQLSARERQLLWLAHVEGFDHKEIARALGLKVGSVRVLLFRARGELARALREGSRAEQGR